MEADFDTIARSLPASIRKSLESDPVQIDPTPSSHIQVPQRELNPKAAGNTTIDRSWYETDTVLPYTNGEQKPPVLTQGPLPHLSKIYTRSLHDAHVERVKQWEAKEEEEKIQAQMMNGMTTVASLDNLGDVNAATSSSVAGVNSTNSNTSNASSSQSDNTAANTSNTTTGANKHATAVVQPYTLPETNLPPSEYPIRPITIREACDGIPNHIAGVDEPLQHVQIQDTSSETTVDDKHVGSYLSNLYARNRAREAAIARTRIHTKTSSEELMKNITRLGEEIARRQESRMYSHQRLAHASKQQQPQTQAQIQELIRNNFVQNGQGAYQNIGSSKIIYAGNVNTKVDVDPSVHNSNFQSTVYHDVSNVVQNLNIFTPSGMPVNTPITSDFLANVALQLHSNNPNNTMFSKSGMEGSDNYNILEAWSASLQGLGDKKTLHVDSWGQVENDKTTFTTTAKTYLARAHLGPGDKPPSRAARPKTQQANSNTLNANNNNTLTTPPTAGTTTSTSTTTTTTSLQSPTTNPSNATVTVTDNIPVVDSVPNPSATINNASYDKALATLTTPPSITELLTSTRYKPSHTNLMRSPLAAAQAPPTLDLIRNQTAAQVYLLLQRKHLKTLKQQQTNANEANEANGNTDASNGSEQDIFGNTTSNTNTMTSDMSAQMQDIIENPHEVIENYDMRNFTFSPLRDISTSSTVSKVLPPVSFSTYDVSTGTAKRMNYNNEEIVKTATNATLNTDTDLYMPSTNPKVARLPTGQAAPYGITSEAYKQARELERLRLKEEERLRKEQDAEALPDPDTPEPSPRSAQMQAELASNQPLVLERAKLYGDTQTDYSADELEMLMQSMTLPLHGVNRGKSTMNTTNTGLTKNVAYVPLATTSKTFVLDAAPPPKPPVDPKEAKRLQMARRMPGFGAKKQNAVVLPPPVTAYSSKLLSEPLQPKLVTPTPAYHTLPKPPKFADQTNVDVGSNRVKVTVVNSTPAAAVSSYDQNTIQAKNRRAQLFVEADEIRDTLAQNKVSVTRGALENALIPPVSTLSNEERMAFAPSMSNVVMDPQMIRVKRKKRVVKAK